MQMRDTTIRVFGGRGGGMVCGWIGGTLILLVLGASPEGWGVMRSEMIRLGKQRAFWDLAGITVA